ncbi:hypothetical protein Glove_114g30 [Diversispora epigaea]|uniref:Protein kinase domain-containing protein n=1 Tax=Diversispora epigaea TaxID=1348612 RepID=A0A397J3T8_9GLOM|nr:hypothetical protein Glove_114g30 [Diversispora epigaea]
MACYRICPECNREYTNISNTWYKPFSSNISKMILANGQVVFRAKWIDGPIRNGILEINSGTDMIAKHLKASESASIRIYGITQDPETNEYIYGCVYTLYISDFGLSKLIEQNVKNPEKRNIFGVLSYISPEVLSGEEYTKAADVYSFGIIAYEIVTGDLARQICDGLRPIIFHIPKSIPTFEELNVELRKYIWDHNKKKIIKTTSILPIFPT